jgi:RNA polymerase sigma-70 factor (ECF subfamily)
MTEKARATLLSFLAVRYDDLKTRLTRRLGSAELAGEALQDTYLRLGHTDTDGMVRSPGAYIFRMAFNIAMDHRRAESRRLSVAEIHDLLNIADDAPGPEQIVGARSEIEALERVIEELPPRRRAVLLAARLEGLPQRQIALRLGISLRLVEKELKRAQEYCAERLGK